MLSTPRCGVDAKWTLAVRFVVDLTRQKVLAKKMLILGLGQHAIKGLCLPCIYRLSTRRADTATAVINFRLALDIRSRRQYKCQPICAHSQRILHNCAFRNLCKSHRYRRKTLPAEEEEGEQQQHHQLHCNYPIRN